MKDMAFSARDLHRAADIYDMMLRDTECGVILTLAGSMVSAGLKKVFVDMVRNNMVDAIVSTGGTSSTRTSSRPSASSTTSPRTSSRAGCSTASCAEHERSTGSTTR